MTNIIQEIQDERAQIQAQERDLNIKKIQLSIKELYAAFAYRIRYAMTMQL